MICSNKIKLKLEEKYFTFFQKLTLNVVWNWANNKFLNHTKSQSIDLDFITKISRMILNKVFNSLWCTYKDPYLLECDNLARFTSNGNLFWGLHLSTIAENINDLIKVR